MIKFLTVFLLLTLNAFASYSPAWVSAPGVTKPKTCYYAFGGASATLASPTICTAGTCVEIYDSCGTGTPPTFSSTGNYAGLTFAAGTFANSSYISCKCAAFSPVNANERSCVLSWATGNNPVISTSASGGYVVTTYTTQQLASSNPAINSYISVECTGKAP
jgi:hypothetical protein